MPMPFELKQLPGPNNSMIWYRYELPAGYPHGCSQRATPDEIRIAEYVQELEAENARLKGLFDVQNVAGWVEPGHPDAVNAVVTVTAELPQASPAPVHLVEQPVEQTPLERNRRGSKHGR